MISYLCYYLFIYDNIAINIPHIIMNDKPTKLYGVDRDLLAVALMVAGSVCFTLGFIFAN